MIRMKQMRALVFFLLLSCTSPALAGTLRIGLQPGGGVALQNDAYLLGVRVGLMHEAVPALQVDAGVFGALGPYIHGARVPVHLKVFFLEPGPFRIYALGGASAWFYWPRGDYGTWCEERGAACSGRALGADLGLGVAFPPLAAELFVGTGALPLYAILLTAAVWP